AAAAYELCALLTVLQSEVALADRILVAEVLPRQRLVHDHAPDLAALVPAVEQPPADERHAHRLEVIMGDHADVGDRFLPGLRLRLADDLEPGGRAQPVQRKKAGAAGRLDAGQ